MTRLSPASAATSGRAGDGPALAVWHAGWAAACAILALGAQWLNVGVDGSIAAAVLVMAAPGLINLFLLRRDDEADRAVALGVWTLAALIASGLTGGLTGALAGFVTMPLAAGLALGGPRLAQAGAAGTGVAILAGLTSSLLVVPGDARPGLAAAVALMAVMAVGVGLRLSGRAGAARLAAAEGAAARAETLLAAQPGLTLVLDPSGQVLAAYGTPPAGLPIDPLFEAGLIASVHAPDRPAVLSAIDKALRGQSAQTLFVPRTALDRRLSLAMRRLDEGAGGGRLVAQLLDGTVEYAREIGLDAARADAEAQNAGKTRFLANMSHELRTPLNAVLGFSDIMRRQMFGPLLDKYAGYADSIHQAGGHLLDLINDVLDVSKIEADRYQLSPEQFDAREVVSTAVALMRPQADDKGLTVSTVLPPEPTLVNADRRALKQITLNLLSNAVKFTPEGGTVTVTAETVGPYLELVVADTGVGIAPEDLRRLGRPFEQAGGAEQRSRGTGLGLSLVRSLTELHGGRMSIESTLGEGAAIMVRLPVVVIEASVPSAGGAEVVPLGTHS